MSVERFLRQFPDAERIAWELIDVDLSIRQYAEV